MLAMGWRYDGQSGGFYRDEDWLSRNQAQAAISAALLGREYTPSYAQHPESDAIIVVGDKGSVH